MTNNKWIEHIKDYAKKNNLSYACALSHPNVKDGYEKAIKKTKKQKDEDNLNEKMDFYLSGLRSKIKNMTDEDKSLVKMKFNSYRAEVRDEFIKRYPNLYKKLN